MKYLGIDWGMRSLGFALSEGELASPLKSVEVKSLNQALHEVDQVIQSEGIEKVVVGLPESGEIRRAIEGVVEVMRGKGIDTVVVDETLSTKEATNIMVTMGTSKKQRSQDHSRSATLILQRYLDN